MITKQSEAHLRLLRTLPVRTHTRAEGIERNDKPRRFCIGCKTPIPHLQQYMCTECRKKYDAARVEKYGERDGRRRVNTWLPPSPKVAR